MNPDGKDPNKPTQLWSQGETAHNSVWFPTLDVPNQKMTQEIYLTVDTSFVTLSNGLLLSQQLNGNGTRTDYWKQSLPAPPYLTMIGVGRWSVTRERWNNIELSYYTDPAYAPYARRIFGKTAEMLDFFSEKLGYPFVWEKYAQVCVHEYISGAMENATAVVHGTGIQQDPRQQLDYDYEDVIAHELIHHWFGDLVTCASWSNVVLNEGFANYGEYLWREHAYGSDDADRLNIEDLSSYLAATSKSDPPAVRYRYEDAEDLFDAVSYNKGGRILHLLRRQIGDDAFFASLKLYLQRHAFGNAEVDDFRQAVEEVTGEDLHWFFDQWYFRPGRPILNVDYAWDESARTMSVMLEQQQSMEEHAPYRLPMLIDVYTVNGRKSVPVDFNSAKQTIRIPLEQAPELVNVDANKRILCTRRDNKPKEWLPYQYAHGPRYYDRWEAVSKLSENYEVGSAGGKTIFSALQDPYWRIRKKAVESIGSWMQSRADTALPAVKRLATGDPESAVRSEAWRSLRRFAEYDDYA
ncbi:MAG TPA: M1 family metallopeptidase [Bacteroidia bacterium]|nr:M1 family metallopeptidase [Bacteroidia bacterium]